MGTQSAFFGPAKYSILPQHLKHEEELVSGNAWVELGTFVAILLGTIAGGLVTKLQNPGLPVVIGVLLVAGFGIATSYKIPSAAAAWRDPHHSAVVFYISRDEVGVFSLGDRLGCDRYLRPFGHTVRSLSLSFPVWCAMHSVAMKWRSLIYWQRSRLASGRDR